MPSSSSPAADLDLEWLVDGPGTDLVGRVAYAEDHHGGLPDGTPATRATVLAIKTAHGRYEPHTPGDRALYPVPGSAMLKDVDRVDGTESDLPGMRLNGYVVELELAVPPS